MSARRGAIAGLSPRGAAAALDLAEERAKEAADELRPVIDGTAHARCYPWSAAIEALLYDAVAHRRLGHAPAAATSLERALALAEHARRSCASCGTCRPTPPSSSSTNTVRTDLRHIYAKLGAHSRSEAVTRARQHALRAPAKQSIERRRSHRESHGPSARP